MAAKIKGVVLASRKRFVEDRFGSVALQRIVSTISQEDRDVMSGIVLASAWYDADLVARFDAAIIREIGGESTAAFKELGRQSASQNLERLHAAYIRGKTPMQFLEQTPTVYRQYYESGRREFIAMGPTRGAIVTHDADGASEGDCYTVMGWYEKALELTGAHNVRIGHTICRARGGAVCRYEVSWEAKGAAR